MQLVVVMQRGEHGITVKKGKVRLPLLCFAQIMVAAQASTPGRGRYQWPLRTSGASVQASIAAGQE